MSVEIQADSRSGNSASGYRAAHRSAVPYLSHLHDIPQTSVGCPGQRVTVPHMDHELGVGLLIQFPQIIPELLAHRNPSVCRVGLQHGGYLGVGALVHVGFLMGDGNESAAEVYIFPHEPQNFTTAHSCGQGDKNEGVGSRSLYGLQKPFRLVIGQRFFSFLFIGRYDRIPQRVKRNRCVKD